MAGPLITFGSASPTCAITAAGTVCRRREWKSCPIPPFFRWRNMWRSPLPPWSSALRRSASPAVSRWCRRGIVELCRALRAIPGLRELCLTTNGSQLTALAAPLRDAGVDRLNISLDTLHPEHFRAMTRTGSLEDVLSGIQAAERAGFKQLKLDTVLIGGFNDNEIRPLAELTLTHPMEVRFIELMPMGPCAGWDKACFSGGHRIGASAGAKGTAAGGRSAAVPSAGGCWNGGAYRPPEPRILRGLPAESASRRTGG